MNHAKTDKKTIGFLLGLLLVTCLVVFHKFIFGNLVPAFTDMGSDTYDQYLMHYQTIINHLRDGDFSLWDFNNGMGINMFSLNLFDPFLVILYLFGAIFGAMHIYRFLTALIIVRILLGGLLIYLFLSCFRLSEKSKLLASYVYGLNGFLIVWGQHYQFGTIPLLFPLLLLVTEKAISRWRLTMQTKDSHVRVNWSLLGLSLVCFLCCVSSLYFSYMQLLVLGFYILFRIGWEDNLFTRQHLKQIGKLYGSMLLGIGMGLFSLVPSAAMIFQVSNRVSNDSFLQRMIAGLQPYDITYYNTLAKKMLSSNLEGINIYDGYANYYEAPNLFLSALFIFAAVQFFYGIFRKEYKLRQRILLLLALVLCGFVLLIPLGSTIFNGFSYPFSRHTFLVLPFFVWIIADVLDDILDQRRLNLPLLVLSVCPVLFIYFRSYKTTGYSFVPLLMAAALGIAIFLVLLAFIRRHSLRALFYGGLTFCLVTTMAADSYCSYFFQRELLEGAPSEYFNELYDPSITEALEAIASRDDSFYRVEKDYTTGSSTSCLNGLAQNYSGISTYNSTLNAGTLEYYQKLWPNLMVTNSTHYSFANAASDDFQASLNHVKYVLTKNPDFKVAGYEPFGTCGDITVYENTNTGQLAKFYTQSFTTADYEQAAGNVNNEAVLAENLLCDTLPSLTRPAADLAAYQKTPVASQEDISITSPDGFRLLLTLPEELPLPADTTTEKYLLEFDITTTNILTEFQVTGGPHTTSLVTGPQSTHVTVSLSADTREILLTHGRTLLPQEASITNLCLYQVPVQDLNGLSQGIQIDACKRDSRITGTAKVSVSGVLMLAVPYETGWHAYVDGVETEIQKVNYGLSGICLEAGDHEIVMEYRCPGFRTGMFGSLLTLLLFIGIWGFLGYRAHKKNIANRK